MGKGRGSEVKWQLQNMQKSITKNCFPAMFLLYNESGALSNDLINLATEVNHSQLDEKNRWLAILSTLIGCQGIDEYKALLPASFHFGLTPVEVKEMVYQATAYLGIGRVFPFLKATNEIFTELGIALPVQGQATTTTENRLEKGIEAQVAIFGEHMKDFYQSGDPESKQIHY